MEEFIKKTVENEERRKTRLKNIKIKVHVFKQDEPEENFITEIRNKEHKKSFRTTNCSSLQDLKRGYYIFHCRRSGDVFKRSHRVVGCKAYISFKRIFTQHNGHDSSEEDGHFQQIHPQLVDQIKKWITLGVKPDVILLQANEWSRAQGEANYHSREYFVTPEDIHNIRTTLLRGKHLDKDDCKSTDKLLLTGPFKDDVIFYQPLGKDHDLIIVLQTELMRKDIQDHGSNIVFFDATHCVNQYSFPLFTLLVRDDHGHGNFQKTDFDRMAKEFLNDFSHYQDVCKYFKRHWEPISNRWADYGRCYNHGNSETNNLIERFFHRLKYQLLSGIRNRRLDDLLDGLLCKTETYFQIIKHLQSVGRMPNSIAMTLEETFNKATGMMEKGWPNLITSESSDAYNVPSEQDPSLSYRTCSAECFCSCPVGVRGQ
ncbi:putative metabotropic glutamate receptor 7, partial [Triplophysa rosa]